VYLLFDLTSLVVWWIDSLAGFFAGNLDVCIFPWFQKTREESETQCE
jgi:hypothetical protein